MTVPVYILVFLAGFFTGAVIHHYDLVNHVDHKKYFQKYREHKKWKES